MPVHDWGCADPDCDGVELDRYQPRNALQAPLCHKCGKPMERLWSLTAKSGLADGDQLSKPFTFDMGQGRIVRFEKLSEVRSFERMSEKAVADGVPGAQPYVFRHLSNSKANQDRNVFGENPNMQPLQRRTRRGIPFQVGIGDPPSRRR